MPDRILPADPRAQYLAHQAEIDAAVLQVMVGGQYILGDQVAAFEEEFARYVGTGHAVGTGSGTDALVLALRVLGIGAGDAVLTVSHTAVATVAAIELTGATPVFVDIDADSYTMDPQSLEAAIGAHRGLPLRAVIPVHLYGHPAAMPQILQIANRHGLAVIEDCAQAHGALIDSRHVGTSGVMSAFSFYPTKNLGALGDAGALVCASGEHARLARELRQYGWRERYVSAQPGMNTRLDELQAAILRVKLPYLKADNARRRAIAERYGAGLAHTDLIKPATRPGCTHAYHQYTLLCRDRNARFTRLQSAGVQPALLYPLPVHRQPAYEGRLRDPPISLAVTERVCRSLLCLPIHPQLSDAAVDTVIAQLSG